MITRRSRQTIRQTADRQEYIETNRDIRNESERQRKTEAVVETTKRMRLRKEEIIMDR